MFVGGTSYGSVWSIAAGDRSRIYITVSEQANGYVVGLLESLCIRSWLVQKLRRSQGLQSQRNTSSFFSGHWVCDPGHQNFEASVPKGHQNMNVFVGPWLLM